MLFHWISASMAASEKFASKKVVCFWDHVILESIFICMESLSVNRDSGHFSHHWNLCCCWLTNQGSEADWLIDMFHLSKKVWESFPYLVFKSLGCCCYAVSVLCVTLTKMSVSCHWKLEILLLLLLLMKRSLLSLLPGNIFFYYFFLLPLQQCLATIAASS